MGIISKLRQSDKLQSIGILGIALGVLGWQINETVGMVMVIGGAIGATLSLLGRKKI